MGVLGRAGPGRRRRDRHRVRLDPRHRRAAAGRPGHQRRRGQRDHHRQHAVRLDLLAERRRHRCSPPRSRWRSRWLVLAAARPLLLATLDPELAVAARRAGPRCSALGFLGALAVVTAESTQAVGALLLLGLIAAPAGAARAAHRAPLPGARPLGRDRRGRHVGRAGPQLRDRRPAAEQRDHRPGRGRVRRLRRRTRVCAASARRLAAPAANGDGSEVRRACPGGSHSPGRRRYPEPRGGVSPACDEAHIRRSQPAPQGDGGRCRARGCPASAIRLLRFGDASSTWAESRPARRQLSVSER